MYIIKWLDPFSKKYEFLDTCDIFNSEFEAQYHAERSTAGGIYDIFKVNMIEFDFNKNTCLTK